MLMYAAETCVSYSVTVFIIVFIAGCIVNLLKSHFVFQLTGITFFFTYALIKVNSIIRQSVEIQAGELFYGVLPLLSGISACLVSMVLGFLVFPRIRRRFKD